VLTPDDALNCACASTRYRDDSLGNWSAFAPNTLAYTNKGLRVWEARTNSIRNNAATGAVVGTPGTLPTNWSFRNAAGLSQQIVGVGTQNGIDYIDIRLSGTSTGGSITLIDETISAIAAASGQTWTASVFVALVGGTTTNVTLWQSAIGGWTSGGASSETVGSVIYTPTATLTRLVGTAALANAGTAFVNHRFDMNINNAAAIDFTLRIGWPQLEQASFASPPIRTTSAAVTTAAEAITLITPPAFGSVYSYYAAAIPYATVAYGTTQRAIAVYANASNRTDIYRSNGTGTAAFSSVSGGSGLVGTGAVWAQSAFGRVAVAIAASDQAGVFNGGTPFTSAGALPIGVNQVRLGTYIDGTLQWDGDITEFAIWPNTRVPNANLITGTQ
jgi:hypothetical protein